MPAPGYFPADGGKAAGAGESDAYDPTRVKKPKNGRKERGEGKF